MHGRILVRVATDPSRHAGQADIIRELIDRPVGLTSQSRSLPRIARGWIVRGFPGKRGGVAWAGAGRRDGGFWDWGRWSWPGRLAALARRRGASRPPESSRGGRRILRAAGRRLLSAQPGSRPRP